MPVRAAIVHYHLRPGGVTRVIAHSVAALGRLGVRTAVLADSPPDDDRTPIANVQAVEGLNYESAGVQPVALAARLEAAARRALGGVPDVWHFHNHALGKNPALTLAVHRLAARGHRLLLHLYDFAEDGRPADYQALLRHAAGGDAARLGRLLYPRGPRIHYAVQNSRDLGFLRKAGADPARSHLLPNAVCLEDASPAETGPAHGGRVFLYPTRAIRRKNVGEFLLWACLARPGDRFIATLAPTSPSDRRPYERWKAVAARLRWPVEFERGLQSAAPLSALMRAATAVLTTSVSEGFGLAFLEPSLLGVPLVGRDLPELTGDFAGNGVRLPGLYRRLLVPLDWPGRTAFRRALRNGLTTARRAYGKTTSPDDLERAFRAATDGDRVDFGRLHEPLQEKVLLRLSRTGGADGLLEPADLTTTGWTPRRLSANRRVVAECYGLEAYGARLLALYRALAREEESAPLEGLDGQSLLDDFLHPERFHLLLT